MYGRRSFPRGTEDMHDKCNPSNPVSCWSEVDASGFMLRSKDYLQTKEKLPSKPAVCRLYRNDILLVRGSRACACRHHTECLIRACVRACVLSLDSVWGCCMGSRRIVCANPGLTRHGLTPRGDNPSPRLPPGRLFAGHQEVGAPGVGGGAAAGAERHGGVVLHRALEGGESVP
jgi:hypothetical protein